ncbi:MAG: helix-turn-helix domain-containing protein [Clostridia bacterium]|nr:helix-turn-helix domain-containing protein [Clostridia bacterium]
MTKYVSYNIDIAFQRVHIELEEGVYLIGFGYEDFTNRESFRRLRKLNDHVLQFIEFGEGSYQLNNKHYVLTKNDLFYIPYNQPVLYKKNPQNPYKYYWLNLKGPRVDNFLSKTLISQEKPVLHIEQAEQMLNLFRSFDTLRIPHEFQLKALTYSIFALIGKIGKDEVPTLDPRMLGENIREYIHINYSQPTFSVGQIAEQFHMSTTQLYRICLKELGISAKQYLIDYRMKQAKILLDKGNSVTSTAYECGFTDLYYFSKFFKQYYGIAPTDYKKETP